jgi:anti-sigma factor RsiW
MKTKTPTTPAGRHRKLTKLTCKEIAEHICSELDEKLDSPRCRRIKEHLALCPNCAAYLDSMKKTVKLYRKYPTPKLSIQCKKKLFSTLGPISKTFI